MRPRAPFFMQFKFYQPFNTNKDKHAAHVKYIATRPGVELSERRPDAESPETDNAIFMQYLQERPRSHGLFGSAEEGVDIKAVAGEAKCHEGIVWRGILSLREDDAIRYGHTDRTKWEETLRATMPYIGLKLGIEERDFRWYAAFHKEPGHYHVHLIFWDKSCRRRDGKFARSELRYARGLFVGEIYGPERRRLLAEKTMCRDRMRELGVELLTQPMRLPSAARATLQNALTSLAFALPTRGRMFFAFMPPEVKEEALRVADLVLGQTAFARQVQEYGELAEQVAAYHTSRPEQLQLARQNAIEDLRERIAQVAIKGAVGVRRSWIEEGYRTRRTINQASSLFLQTGALLRQGRTSLRLEEAREYLKSRVRQDGLQHVEINKQKEVERA